MVIELCSCDRYPEPHDHARIGWMTDDGMAMSHIKWVDGSWAQVGDVVRWVDWRDEAKSLALAIRSWVCGSQGGEGNLHAAYAHWDQAVAEDGHAVEDQPVAKTGATDDTK
jgi:hypothetical protein